MDKAQEEGTPRSLVKERIGNRDDFWKEVEQAVRSYPGQATELVGRVRQTDLQLKDETGQEVLGLWNRLTKLSAGLMQTEEFDQEVKVGIYGTKEQLMAAREKRVRVGEKRLGQLVSQKKRLRVGGKLRRVLYQRGKQKRWLSLMIEAGGPGWFRGLLEKTDHAYYEPWVMELADFLGCEDDELEEAKEYLNDLLGKYGKGETDVFSKVIRETHKDLDKVEILAELWGVEASQLGRAELSQYENFYLKHFGISEEKRRQRLIENLASYLGGERASLKIGELLWLDQIASLEAGKTNDWSQDQILISLIGLGRKAEPRILKVPSAGVSKKRLKRWKRERGLPKSDRIKSWLPEGWRKGFRWYFLHLAPVVALSGWTLVTFAENINLPVIGDIIDWVGMELELISEADVIIAKRQERIEEGRETLESLIGNKEKWGADRFDYLSEQDEPNDFLVEVIAAEGSDWFRGLLEKTDHEHYSTWISDIAEWLGYGKEGTSVTDEYLTGAVDHLNDLLDRYDQGETDVFFKVIRETHGDLENVEILAELWEVDPAAKEDIDKEKLTEWEEWAKEHHPEWWQKNFSGPEESEETSLELETEVDMIVAEGGVEESKVREVAQGLAEVLAEESETDVGEAVQAMVTVTVNSDHLDHEALAMDMTEVVVGGVTSEVEVQPAYEEGQMVQAKIPLFSNVWFGGFMLMIWTAGRVRARGENILMKLVLYLEEKRRPELLKMLKGLAERLMTPRRRKELEVMAKRAVASEE